MMAKLEVKKAFYIFPEDSLPGTMVVPSNAPFYPNVKKINELNR